MAQCCSKLGWLWETKTGGAPKKIGKDALAAGAGSRSSRGRRYVICTGDFFSLSAPASMPLFYCTHCGQPVEADDQDAGKEGHCPGCNAIIIVPGPPRVDPGEHETLVEGSASLAAEERMPVEAPVEQESPAPLRLPPGKPFTIWTESGPWQPKPRPVYDSSEVDNELRPSLKTPSLSSPLMKICWMAGGVFFQIGLMLASGPNSILRERCQDSVLFLLLLFVISLAVVGAVGFVLGMVASIFVGRKIEFPFIFCFSATAVGVLQLVAGLIFWKDGAPWMSTPMQQMRQAMAAWEAPPPKKAPPPEK